MDNLIRIWYKVVPVSEFVTWTFCKIRTILEFDPLLLGIDAEVIRMAIYHRNIAIVYKNAGSTSVSKIILRNVVIFSETNAFGDADVFFKLESSY